MNISIRPAIINDKARILSIIKSHDFKWDVNIAETYYDDYFTEHNKRLKGDKVYVGLEGEKVVGVTGYFIDRYETKSYWLGWFYIDKSHVNRGYGKQLFRFIKNTLKNIGVTKLFVNTSSDYFYKTALNFYLDHGFRIEAVIRDYYWKGEDQFILSKDL